MSDLTPAEIVTRLGATYVFPDVPRDMLKTVVLESSWRKNGVFVLVNVSGASISIPSRIIRSVAWDGEVKVECDGS